MLLIRHSAVTIDPAKPAREWCLSVDGRSRTRQLASRLIPYTPTRIITSQEPKASETGQIIADALGIPWQTTPNLHEHERTGVPFFASRDDFVTAVTHFFNTPDQLVFGQETANQALERFDTAVHHLTTTHPDDTLAIVSHGTVLTLFLAHYNQLNPVPFWQNLNLPDFFVVSLPDMLLQND